MTRPSNLRLLTSPNRVRRWLKQFGRDLVNAKKVALVIVDEQGQYHAEWCNMHDSEVMFAAEALKRRAMRFATGEEVRGR